MGAPREIQLERLGRIASMANPFTHELQPAVWKKTKSDGYGVRVLMGYSAYGLRTSVSWDYFDLDANGVITACPRGMTRQFKGLKVVNIDAKVEEYKDKEINQP